MSNDEQRQHPRVTVNKEFESIDTFVSEYVTNISQGGVFIRSKNPLPEGTEVNLKFSILTEDFEMIEGIGRVVRVEEHGMGVVFTKLTPQSQKIVDALTAARAASPAEPAPPEPTDPKG
jgi:Tfp pilus assembly protein PilZ